MVLVKTSIALRRNGMLRSSPNDVTAVTNQCVAEQDYRVEYKLVVKGEVSRGIRLALQITTDRKVLDCFGYGLDQHAYLAKYRSLCDVESPLIVFTILQCTTLAHYLLQRITWLDKRTNRRLFADRSACGSAGCFTTAS